MNQIILLFYYSKKTPNRKFLLDDTNSIFFCVKRSMPNVLPFIFPAFSHMWFVQMTHCHIFQLSERMCCVVWTLTHSLVRWAWYTDSCIYWVKNMKMCLVITLLLKQIQGKKESITNKWMFENLVKRKKWKKKLSLILITLRHSEMCFHATQSKLFF